MLLLKKLLKIATNTEGSIKTHKRSNGSKTVRPFADDGQFEPVELLKKALILRGLSDNDFFVLKEGRFRDLWNRFTFS